MKKTKIKYLNIKRSKIKDFVLRTFSALSITLLINGFPKTLGNETAMEDKETHIFYSQDYKFLNCGTYDSEIEITQYFNNHTKNLNIESLEIINNSFITNLSCFRPYYSQIKSIIIRNCSSLFDLSEIFKMNNLKYIYIDECPGITRYFVDCLNKMGIEHNIKEQDIVNCEKMDSIIKEITNDQMSEREKIKSIVNYITNNYSYDLNYTIESNKRPISCFLENNKGVCASYAFFANVLFRKAGIESYELKSFTHAWNVVKLNNKYYYIDVTNLDHDLEKYLLNTLDFGFCFLSNPGENDHTIMEDYNAGKEKIFISQNLRDEIAKTEEFKSFCEKYPNLSVYYSITFFMSMLDFGSIYLLIEIIKMKLENKKRLQQFLLDDYQKDYNYIKLKKKSLK